MASVIKPKRSAVANTPPTTANIEQYEIAINTADKKIYTRDGSDNILVIGAGNVSGLADVSVSTPAAGQLLVYNSGTNKWTNGSSIGTAISITDSTASTSTTTGALKITGGVGIGGALNVGGNITASTNLVSTYSAGDEGGEIQLAKPQTNSTLAGAISIDIYQNKLRIFENGGTARGVYIDLTAASAGVGTNLMSGGGGTVTSVSGTGTVAGLSLSGTVTTSGSLTLSGTLSTPVSTINDSTTVGQNLVKLTNPSAITFLRVNADNTISTLDAATFRTAIGAGTSSTTGTVTSVGGTGTVAGLSLSGTVTTSGNLTLSGTLSTPVSTINDSTTVGQNLVKLTNPTAVTFLRVNADNTVSALDAATFRTAIGAQASGSYLTTNQTITLSGDVTGSGSTAITTTLANSGVTAGSYTLASITVDAKGRITAASSGTAGASLTGLTQDSGSFITSLGAGAGQSGSGGAVTIGYQAGQSNSYGGGGVHIGYQAGKASIGGNITIGNSAGVALGYGPYCTIIGTSAATSITSASYNTIIGAEAAKQAGNIDHLTAIGNMSGFYASGNASTLLGSNAGYYSGGIERVALGAYSMRGSPSWNSTGAYSVGVGAYTLFNYTSGEKNVAVGHSALYSATTSKWNVAIGHNAGYGLTTGSDNNVIIGYLAGYTGTNNLTSSATNNILIGASAQASSSTATNEITLGNSSITRLRIPGLGIDWTSATVPTGGGGGGGTSITNTIVTTTTQTATKDNRYILTNASATTVTLPATPTLGDTVYIIVANGLTTNVIARNGSPIMGLAEDLTVDGSTASFGLFYVNSTLGWRII